MRCRFAILALGFACSVPALAGVELEMIHDSGKSVPLAPYVAQIVGGTDEANVLDGLRFPFRSQLRGGVLKQDGVQVFNGQWLTQPMFVIGADDAIKGMIPIAFIVARADAASPDVLASRVIGSVRAELGAVAALKTAYVVPQLPKTRSGKILRNLLRKIVNGEDWECPATIDDPSVPDIIRNALRAQDQRDQPN